MHKPRNLRGFLFLKIISNVKFSSNVIKLLSKSFFNVN